MKIIKYPIVWVCLEILPETLNTMNSTEVWACQNFCQKIKIQCIPLKFRLALNFCENVKIQ